MKSNMRNSFFIVALFFVLAIMSSLCISTLETAYRDNVTKNLLFSKNARDLNIKNVQIPDFMEYLMFDFEDSAISKKNISIGAFEGEAILIKNFDYDSPKLIEGRFFNEEELVSKEPVMVGNKTLVKHFGTISKNGNEYIFYNGVEYKLIGIMGYQDKDTIYDYKFYINLLPYLASESPENIEDEWSIYTEDKSDLLKVTNSLKQNLNTQIEFLDNEESSSVLASVIRDYNMVMITLVVLFIVLFLNTASISVYWIDSKRKEIGVRKAFGARNFQIIKRLILEYMFFALLSFLAGLIVYIIIIKLNLLNLFNSDIYLATSFIVLLTCLAFAFFSIIMTASRTLKVPPSDIMKG